jgi:tetratricopeptide (TPR) repeat protein
LERGAPHLTVDWHSAVIRKQFDWVVEATHRIFADAFEIEIAFDEVGERARQQHGLPQLFGEGFETRSHIDRRTDDGEVEPGARPDIAVHDVPDVDADAVIQRRATGFAVLFVQGNYGLTGFGHGMQQIGAGVRLAERKNGEQAVADEFQYFSAMSRNRLRHHVEIAVQEINDVIAWPVVGDPGEITQIADHDGRAYRRPASAPGGAGQNELAGMRADIGFEQRSRQPVLDTDFADQRQDRQQFRQAGKMHVVETAEPVGCKGHEVPLAERVVQWACLSAHSEAEGTGNPMAICQALSWCGCSLFLSLEELDRAAGAIHRFRQVAQDNNIKSYVFSSIGFEGRLLFLRGEIEPAERCLRDALSKLGDAQYENVYIPFLGRLAELLAADGRSEEALLASAESLERTKATEALWLLPDALRIHGEVLASVEGPYSQPAETYLRESIEVCVRQEALGWELRSAESLANFLWQQSRTEEASVHLDRTLGKFVEGFETAPFRRAKNLLDEMRAATAPEEARHSAVRPGARF